MTYFVVSCACVLMNSNNLVTTQYLAKFQSPRAITRPNFIGLERNLNLICRLSVYTPIPNIKSISQSRAKKVVTTVLFRNYEHG